MGKLKGDFIGFTFNGIHSSDLGIVRTSGGDRYERSLFPSFTDKTLQIPGGDGAYYFGTTFNQKPLRIDIAYDSLTEEQFERLAVVFGERKIVPFIFDEQPYKVYRVKISGDANFTSICFDEGGQRIYKGEGSFQITSYSPFAKSRFKYLEDYTVENIPEWAPLGDEPVGSDGLYDFTGSAEYNNLDEWIVASGIKSKVGYDVYNISTRQMKLYNGGQLPTDFNLYIPFLSETIPAFEISLDTSMTALHFKEITKLNENDVKIKINTKLNLIEGVDENNNKTGSVYNQFIEKGFFFQIPRGEHILMTSPGIAQEEIEYNFLYY